MSHNVIPELEKMLCPIAELTELPGNARKGALEAVAASLLTFGQHVPIVVQRSTKTILKGNNTFRAARDLLKWTEIAVVFVDDDNEKAVARALVDNRTFDLGGYDEKLRQAQVVEVAEYAPFVFDAVGWDRFEVAEMSATIDRLDGVADTTSGYIPPVMISDPFAGKPTPSVQDGATPSHVIAPEGIDESVAVTGGSSAAGIQQSKVVAQYTLVFDDAEQHREWFRFVRWLRSAPAYDGDSIAAKVISFIEAHSEVD